MPLIAGFGEAARIALSEMQENHEHLRRLRERLWSGVRDLDGIVRNGTESQTFPGILNVSIEDVEGESLLLSLEPLCVATGSACNSKSQEARCRVEHAAQDSDLAVERYREAVGRLRGIAPGRAA